MYTKCSTDSICRRQQPNYAIDDWYYERHMTIPHVNQRSGNVCVHAFRGGFINSRHEQEIMSNQPMMLTITRSKSEYQNLPEQHLNYIQMKQQQQQHDCRSKTILGLLDELPKLRSTISEKQARLLAITKAYESACKETALRENNLNSKKKLFQNERNRIIKQCCGHLPKEILEQDAVRKSVELAQNRNSALRASLDVVETHLQSDLDEINSTLTQQQEIVWQTIAHNKMLENRVKQLTKEKEQMAMKLQQKAETTSTNDKETLEREREREQEQDHQENVFTDTDTDTDTTEYPPEATIVQNLLKAQVEFYFSNYNLKRNKDLLQDVISESGSGSGNVSGNGAPKGFLDLQQVMRMSKVRQLCSNIDILIAALKRSRILTIKGKTVGRTNFEIPRQQEFPFRRTVFVFGIPNDAQDAFLYAMLGPFGKLTKIQFDHGPGTLDRRIGKRFLNRPRVYTLFRPQPNPNSNPNSNHNPILIPMEFKIQHPLPNIKNILCHRCNKLKPVSDGFYSSAEWKRIYCVQCGAQLADDQLQKYYEGREKNDQSHIMWLGAPPLPPLPPQTTRQAYSNCSRAALVVFASQRQAARASYCRTRLSWRGAFACHYHHYSKLKKDILLSDARNAKKKNISNK